MSDNMEECKRKILTTKLESIFSKRVISIIYNPAIEEGILPGDEYKLRDALNRINQNEIFDKSVIILGGSGGDFKTAILMSHLLRNRFSYYSCFVPFVAGSALCYIILHSNKLIFGRNSLLTQIDPLFEHEGDFYRAIKNLSNSDPEIYQKSHTVFWEVNGHLTRLLSHRYSLLNRSKTNPEDTISTKEIIPITDIFMGKENHEDGVRYSELDNVNINLELADDILVELGTGLMKECQSELAKENARVLIQFREGGYFFQ